MITVITDLKEVPQFLKTIPDPKHVWWDIDKVIVTTGADMPPASQ